MKIYIGLDLGLNKTAMCCLDENGKILLQAIVPSDPASLLMKLSPFKDRVELVGLEACPLSEWIYGALREAGYPVFCLETRHTQRFLSTRPNKTDRNDAHGIAAMMRVGHFKPVHVKSRESQLMRALLVGRRQLMTSMLQIENSIRSILRTHGLKLGQIHRTKFNERVCTLCAKEPDLLPAIDPLLSIRNEMREQMRKLNNSLERTSRADPICKLFRTIPGVGPLTSLAFKATIDDPSRFKHSKLVAAHLGLTPRIYQSGEINRSGRISKSGDKLLRHLLCEAATSMLLVSKKWCALKVWAIKLAKRSGTAKAIVALARRIAIIMHRMWITGENFWFGLEQKEQKISA